jgi:hypothetical protein
MERARLSLSGLDLNFGLLVATPLDRSSQPSCVSESSGPSPGNSDVDGLDGTWVWEFSRSSSDDSNMQT